MQPNGAEKLLSLGKLSDYEAGLLKSAVEELKPSISSKQTSLVFDYTLNWADERM